MNCNCLLNPSGAATLYAESLDEMDFARSLHGAAYSGDVVRVARYLEKHTPSAGIDVLDRQGYTALHLAARQGKLQVCELLIKHGADVNLQTVGLGATVGSLF